MVCRVGCDHGCISCPSALEDSMGASDAPDREDRSLCGHEPGDVVSASIISFTAVLTQTQEQAPLPSFDLGTLNF